MSISVLRDKLVAHHRAARTQRAMNIALSKAPTEASRQELLNLYLR